MKPLLLLATIIFVASASCNRNHHPETPQALNENKTLSAGLSKRAADNNLVEALYNELVISDPQLKELESSVDNIDDRKSDSMEAFAKFDRKNSAYYASAAGLPESISDSGLKQNIRTALENSKSNYNSRKSYLSKLADQLNNKSITLTDVHAALKILKTLTIIEQYQKDHLPSAAPLLSVNNEMDLLIAKINSLIKK